MTKEDDDVGVDFDVALTGQVSSTVKIFLSRNLKPDGYWHSSRRLVQYVQRGLVSSPTTSVGVFVSGVECRPLTDLPSHKPFTLIYPPGSYTFGAESDIGDSLSSSA